VQSKTFYCSFISESVVSCDRFHPGITANFFFDTSKMIFLTLYHIICCVNTVSSRTILTTFDSASGWSLTPRHVIFAGLFRTRVPVIFDSISYLIFHLSTPFLEFDVLIPIFLLSFVSVLPFFFRVTCSTTSPPDSLLIPRITMARMVIRDKEFNPSFNL